ncbi:MAG: Mu-like prophage major head subunit gpT family protein [Methylobacter sp.]|uniref:Mu-like prophage major head subunit gpT family protein n=1 Tax=Methylobacter sp. TaxID=2051955 RepID=UPI00258A7A91|nr:Mu-like prophage major head subunit gpT family protein [Methylobacter sp.]MCL7422524.1 Mu-like prophage major head subunit gpT family protein [Methylobacter sp.]
MKAKRIFGLGLLASVYLIALTFSFSGPAVSAPVALDADAALSLAFGGLIVNRAAINTIFTGLKTIFNNALKASPGNWQATAMEVISNGKGEDYAWLSRFPMMRKWIGEKSVKSLEAGKYTAINEDWETTIAVRRNDIEDDSLGIYNAQARMAGDSASELHDIIVDSLKNGAFTGLGIDGQYFYDTDHSVAGASVSNKLTTALSAATPAAAAASYGAARIAIMKFKDEEGMPLRLIPDTLEVPPALEAVAKKLLEADKLDDNSPNPYKGTATLIVNPALTSDTVWFLHVTRKAVKPFIVQMRKRPEFVSQTSMENDDVFMKAEYKFGAEARATGIYGFWQLSVGSTGAG